ncbi:hypothetical protein STAS_16002 [Striga asiatica]|uniref:Uncharacterized protein n=1 Tax=Striga asiatica TaxID=4170 RepID=A0A5A7Q3J6_STRAF|nr:hypothetical protein STAS_16002 [Striga asiatica]
MLPNPVLPKTKPSTRVQLPAGASEKAAEPRGGRRRQEILQIPPRLKRSASSASAMMRNVRPRPNPSVARRNPIAISIRTTMSRPFPSLGLSHKSPNQSPNPPPNPSPRSKTSATSTSSGESLKVNVVQHLEAWINLAYGDRTDKDAFCTCNILIGPVFLDTPTKTTKDMKLALHDEDE